VSKAEQAAAVQLSRALIAVYGEIVSAYDSIMKGSGETLAFAEGKDEGARVHYVVTPTVDLAAIRARTCLSPGARC
jgi:hypothetical protein